MTDDEGLELVDLESAHAVAIRSARDIMSTEIKHGKLHLDCRIDIVNGNGETLDRVQFRDAVSVLN